MTILTVEDVGKAFLGYRREWHRLGRWFGLNVAPSRETWILRHVTFDMQAGEAIGIVGKNGAGKSTLLKLIAGTSYVTEGRTHASGRIAAILELGMGFNRELTGRQNARHVATLMGFSATEIAAKMPEIEEFAEISDYFDQPMRTYSSGMEMRVAFAVATAWRPDILIVDEALSVGDTYFQHKSLSRMREIRAQGTALLIVSHDAQAIKNMCDRAILIENGHIEKDGSPEEIYDYYNAILARSEGNRIEVQELQNGRKRTRSGTGEARIQSVHLHNAVGQSVEMIKVGDAVELRVTVRVISDIEALVLGYGIRDRLGQVVFGTNTRHTDQVLFNPEPGRDYTFRIGFQANLGVGNYSVQIALVDSESHLSKNYEWQDMALLFDVVNVNKPQFAGCLWAEPHITIEANEP